MTGVYFSLALIRAWIPSAERRYQGDGYRATKTADTDPLTWPGSRIVCHDPAVCMMRSPVALFARDPGPVPFGIMLLMNFGETDAIARLAWLFRHNMYTLP